MTQVKLISAWFGWSAADRRELVGILESGAADVFLEATRPDFQKISLGVAGNTKRRRSRLVGGADRRSLSKRM